MVSQQEVKSRAGKVKTVVATIATCFVVFGSIVTYLLIVKDAEIDAKDAQLELLERQLNQLSNIGTVPNDINELITEFSDLSSAAPAYHSHASRSRYGSM